MRKRGVKMEGQGKMSDIASGTKKEGKGPGYSELQARCGAQWKREDVLKGKQLD